MKLEDYIKQVLNHVPQNSEVSFDIGVNAGANEVYVVENSLNRVKFTISKKDRGGYQGYQGYHDVKKFYQDEELQVSPSLPTK